MYFQEAEDILYNFLRARVTEVTRDGLADRISSDSDSFTGDNSTVEFTLTSTPDSVVSITVDATPVIPYADYNIDLANKTVKFRIAPATDAAIVVNYTTGSSWIFPDSPREDLTANSYPRVGLWQITDSESFEELGSTTNTYDSITFQIDVVGYKDQICTVGTDSFSGPNVTKFIAREIKNAFKDNFSTDLIYVVSDFDIIDNSPAPFQENLNIYRRIIQIRFEFRNLRRLVI